MPASTIVYFEKPGKANTAELLEAVAIRASVAAPGASAIAAATFYRFCQGMKVAVEVALMAADAGLLDMDREAIAIGGTGEGADTAIAVKPAFSRTFRDFEIREIIAKPRGL